MENVENNQNVENNAEHKVEIDYEKLSEMITKGKEVKENGILKSFFEQNGLKEDEVKKAIADYKENVRKQEEAIKNKDAELETKLADVQKELKNEKFNNAITLIGYELGLDSKTLKAVQKLAEINVDEVFENNTINQDKIKESINNVLEEYPQFKKSATTNKIVEVGAPDGNDTEDSSNEKLRKMFGLK